MFCFSLRLSVFFIQLNRFRKTLLGRTTQKAAFSLRDINKQPSTGSPERSKPLNPGNRAHLRLVFPDKCRQIRTWPAGMRADQTREESETTSAACIWRELFLFFHFNFAPLRIALWPPANASIHSSYPMTRRRPLPYFRFPLNSAPGEA